MRGMCGEVVGDNIWGKVHGNIDFRNLRESVEMFERNIIKTCKTDIWT